MDIYPAEVFTNIGYFHLDPNIAGGYGKATAYLLSSSEAKTRKTNSLKTPEKTTTVLFVLASVITLIGSAQLASKLQFSRTEI